MYLGIDVGATKTLVAYFDKSGKIIEHSKFPTNKNYSVFLNKLRESLENSALTKKLEAACCAVPGPIDVKSGFIKAFGNLPWKNIDVKKDLSKLLPKVKIVAHNDAKLAGLSEAQFIPKGHSKVLYITISTGIGGAIIIDGFIDPQFETFEPGRALFDYEGKLQKWESFASGKAFFERYGKLAADVDDKKIWQEYSKTVALGLEPLLATLQPDIIIIGGGLGAHMEKFHSYLKEGLRHNKDPLVPIPPIIKAKRPEEAVIYGCYDYIRQQMDVK